MHANIYDHLKTVLKSLGVLSGIIVLLLFLSHNTINSPTEIASTEMATVLSGEFYPSSKYDALAAPKLLIRLDTGVELLIQQNVPINLRHGDRIKVIVWKRRLFGYRTNYERVSSN